LNPLRASDLSAALVSACGLLSACAVGTTGVAPPGVSGPARLFYPTGIAVSPDGETLYVANSNFDRAFNSGTLVSFPASAFDEAAANEDKHLRGLPEGVTARRLDAFAGPLRLNPAGTALYTATRDHGTLSRIPLNADGTFECPEAGCSHGAAELAAQGLADPFALSFADLVFPGSTTPEAAVFVGHLTPASNGQGAAAEDAYVIAVPERLAGGQSDAPFEQGAVRVDIGVPASTSLAFDDVSGRLYVGGCLLRVSAEQVVPCASNPDSSLVRENPLRALMPASGAAANVETFLLGPLTGGGETADLALSSDGTALYALTGRPSALVVVDKPGVLEAIRPRAIVPLANAPSRLLVLPRAEGDLVVVASTESNVVTLVDPVRGEVLSQLEAVGLQPWDLAATRLSDGTDRVFASLFKDCGVVAIDVPAADPSAAAIYATVGACP
jgi:hypothetical protein